MLKIKMGKTATKFCKVIMQCKILLYLVKQRNKKLTGIYILTLNLWFITIIWWLLMMQSLGWFTNSNSFVKAKLHLIRRWHALTQYHDTIFAALCSQEFFFQICLVSRFRRNQGTTAAQKTTNVVIMQCNRWECNLRGKRLGKNRH